jgi:crossover junction endodeoxyribonuclease RuvC
MRVLGVDPGLTRCGIGVIEGAPGRPLRLIGTDVIRTPAADDIGARLLALEQELDRWLARHEPDALALAICHLWRGSAQQRLAAAQRAAGGAR